MSDNIVTVPVDVVPVGSTFTPCMWVCTNPDRCLIDKLVEDIEEMSVLDRPVIVILDNTPRDKLEEMNDYSYLKEDCYKYRYVAQPFWDDRGSKVFISYLDRLSKTLTAPNNPWGYKKLEGL
jgi:hypothetical protein